MNQLDYSTYNLNERTPEGMRHQRPAKPSGPPKRQRQVSTRPTKEQRPDLHTPRPERVPYVLRSGN